MGQGLISLILVNGEVVHIPGNPISIETIRIRGDPGGIGIGHTPVSQGNTEIAHVHRSI